MRCGMLLAVELVRISPATNICSPLSEMYRVAVHMCIATMGKAWGVALLMQCCMLFAHKTLTWAQSCKSVLPPVIMQAENRCRFTHCLASYVPECIDVCSVSQADHGCPIRLCTSIILPADQRCHCCHPILLLQQMHDTWLSDYCHKSTIAALRYAGMFVRWCHLTSKHDF